MRWWCVEFRPGIRLQAGARVVQPRTDLCAQQHDKSGVVYPHQQDDNSAQGAVNKLVTAEMFNIKNKEMPGDFKQNGGDYSDESCVVGLLTC